MPEYLRAIAGGSLIGIASALLLLSCGRIFGISGIVAGVFDRQNRKDVWWRISLILGLICSGIYSHALDSASIPNLNSYDPIKMVLAGLLVGYGTQLGSGCTSGHGVCGVARLSRRSIAATLVFVVAGIITVALTGVE